MPTYIHRAHRVAAIEWTGDNFPEVSAFLVEHLGEECGPRSSRAEDVEAGIVSDYNMVQFEAWGDDQEVDPGHWIVVFPARDEAGDGAIFTVEEFEMDYEPAGATS